MAVYYSELAKGNVVFKKPETTGDEEEEGDKKGGRGKGKKEKEAKK